MWGWQLVNLMVDRTVSFPGRWGGCNWAKGGAEWEWDQQRPLLTNSIFCFCCMARHKGPCISASKMAGAVMRKSIDGSSGLPGESGQIFPFPEVPPAAACLLLDAVVAVWLL